MIYRSCLDWYVEYNKIDLVLMRPQVIRFFTPTYIRAHAGKRAWRSIVDQGGADLEYLGTGQYLRFLL